MKETFLGLHEELQHALAQLGHHNNGAIAAEEPYRVADLFWKRVRQHVRQTGFPDDATEIDFFKNVKARFTAPLEYYLSLLRYQGYAEAGNRALTQHRMDMAFRIRRFREAHAVFIEYYEQSRTEWDDQYFLRTKLHKMQRPPSQAYDRAPDLWTNGDWILTLYHANRQFERFLENTASSTF
ncbi:MAG TPA: RteC domain-containing protein [Puia sp.]|nr:RteC domain-containing protein [Puia sp.]